MKTIKTFFIATILFSLTANSQITKDFWLMGGSGSFSYSEQKGNESSNSYNSYRIDLEPNIGYFVANKLSLGMKFGFARNFTDVYENVQAKYKIGPFARYYFLKEDKQINLFAEPSFERYLEPDNSLGRNTSTTNLKLGTVIFLNDTVGFETGLTYSIFLNDDGYKINTLALGFGLQIHLERNK